METTIEDLINVDDDVGFNNSSVTINHKSEEEKNFYARLIAEKDKIIADKEKEIAFLRGLLGPYE